MSFTPLPSPLPSPETPQPAPHAALSRLPQTAPLSPQPPTAPFTVPLAQAFHRLFSEEERVIVLTLNEAGALTHYEVKPLADILVMLDLAGFGQPLPHAFPPSP